MINEIHFPQSITGPELDEYLSNGWYRMGQFIFTTDLVEFKECIYEVYWLRIALSKLIYGKSQQKIIAKNSGFAVSIHPYRESDEIEELFWLYKMSIDFDTPASVTGSLLNGSGYNIYNTQMIGIRDNKRLIGVGFFDLGENSTAGILNFYHPQYKSKSLGICLLLLAIEHAKQIGKEWFYPGYIANGYSKFDYKLFPDKNATEIYDRASNEWIPFTWALLSGEPVVDRDKLSTG